MARRPPRRATFVPRMIFGAGIVAGVVPLCAIACGVSVETMGGTTTGHGTAGSTGKGGAGGVCCNVAIGGFGGVGAGAFGGFGGVAMMGVGGFGGVAMMGVGGFGGVAMMGVGGFGGSPDGGTTEDASDDGGDSAPSDGGNLPDVWGVAQMGFIVAPPDVALPAKTAQRRAPAKKRARSRG